MKDGSVDHVKNNFKREQDALLLRTLLPGTKIRSGSPLGKHELKTAEEDLYYRLTLKILFINLFPLTVSCSLPSKCSLAGKQTYLLLL